jgi:hypothetical protein
METVATTPTINSLQLKQVLNEMRVKAIYAPLFQETTSRMIDFDWDLVDTSAARRENKLYAGLRKHETPVGSDRDRSMHSNATNKKCRLRGRQADKFMRQEELRAGAEELHSYKWIFSLDAIAYDLYKEDALLYNDPDCHFLQEKLDFDAIEDLYFDWIVALDDKGANESTPDALAKAYNPRRPYFQPFDDFDLYRYEFPDFRDVDPDREIDGCTFGDRSMTSDHADDLLAEEWRREEEDMWDAIDTHNDMFFGMHVGSAAEIHPSLLKSHRRPVRNQKRTQQIYAL